MTSNKRNLKVNKKANQGQGQIKKEFYKKGLL